MASFLATGLVLSCWFVSPTDFASPEAAIVRARLLFVCEGMTDGQVTNRLGLQNRLPCAIAGTVHTQFVVYEIGRKHTLFLCYCWDGTRGGWLLHSAELQRNQQDRSSKK